MNYLILGGDERQRKLCRLFSENGYDVTSITDEGEEKLCESLERSDAVILPLPVSRDGITVYSDREPLKIPIKAVMD